MQHGRRPISYGGEGEIKQRGRSAFGLGRVLNLAQPNAVDVVLAVLQQVLMVAVRRRVAAARTKNLRVLRVKLLLLKLLRRRLMLKQFRLFCRATLKLLLGKHASFLPKRLNSRLG